LSRLIVSADSHVVEPDLLWVDRLPRALRDRAPRIEQGNGSRALLVEGMPPRMLRASDEEGEMPGGSDAGARLRDLRIDGVAAEVIYPTVGLFLFLIPDPELQIQCARVYNDWAAETFFSHPDVFLPSAIVPVRDVGAAAAELERAAGMGYRSAMLPTTAPEGAPWNLEAYDPIWRVAASAGIPLSFHVGTGTLPITERGAGGAVINYVRVGLGSQDTVCYFVAGGVLARHPGLHVVMVEAGAGWIAWLTERMDEAYSEHEHWVSPKLGALPSDYVRRQVHITFGADRAAILAREVTGVEPLLWASDYPHPEGTWPESQKAIERTFEGVPDAEIDAIVGLNARALYRL
jgi:predicted TIM-barrel fold metal-dependent hydrolase